MRILRWLAATALAIGSFAALASTAAAHDGVDDALVAMSGLSADEMVAIFDGTNLAGTDSGTAAPVITGDAETDQRIRALAEQRGYRRRPEANVALDSTFGVPLQPNASVAFGRMRAAAAADGVTINATFGFRPVALQRALFLRRVGVGSSDATINDTLRLVAAPGYSKHHTGYAVDVATSDGYRWLSRNNYQNAIEYGWLPSYPPGTTRPFGPIPEPWEFVFLGAEDLACGIGQCGADSFLFRNGNQYQFSEVGIDTIVEQQFTFATPTADVVVADWDGDTFDSLATRIRNEFSVRNELGSDTIDIFFGYGVPNDQLFMGDWDGDGIDTPAVRRGNVFFIRNDLLSGPAHIVLGYGTATDEVLSGDFDGDGKDSFAVRRRNRFFVRNDLRTGVAEIEFSYGRPDDKVVVGDFDGDGVDTFTVWRGDTLFVNNRFLGGDAEFEVEVPAGFEVLIGHFSLGN